MISSALSDAIQNHSPWLKSSVSGSLIFNTIDNVQDPHNGIYATLTGEGAGLGGNARFLKVTGRATYYKTISEGADIVALLSAGGGYVAPIAGGSLRVFDLFQSDSRMIRGFAYNGIGPVDNKTLDHLGGTTYFDATAEAQFPIPGVPHSMGLKGAVFVDAATLYGNPLTSPEARSVRSVRRSARLRA